VYACGIGVTTLDGVYLSEIGNIGVVSLFIYESSGVRHGANVSSARPFVVVASGKTTTILSGYSSTSVARVVVDDESDVDGDLRVGTDSG